MIYEDWTFEELLEECIKRGILEREVEHDNKHRVHS